MTVPARIPDWFDRLWEENKEKLPFMFRSDAVKAMARTLMDGMIQEMAKAATTPQGVRALIQFSRITAILKGANGVLDAPDPSPEQVAEAVQKLVEKAKAKA